MGAGTPIGIPIQDEHSFTPKVSPTRRVTPRLVVDNNNGPLTKRPLKRSPSHIALVIESLADAKTEPSRGLESVPPQAGLSKTTLRLFAVAAVVGALDYVGTTQPETSCPVRRRVYDTVELRGFWVGCKRRGCSCDDCHVCAPLRNVLDPAVETGTGRPGQS